MSINKYLSKLYIKTFKFFPVGINKFLAKLFKKLHDLNMVSSYGKDFLTYINIENTEFKLWLKKDDHQAQSVYLPMHKKKIIYEAAMIRILISVIKNLNANTFLDLGSFMGYYACFISKYFNEKIKVFAVESNKNYAKYIDQSIIENNFKNVSVINKILSDKVEDLYVYKEGVYKSKNDLSEYILEKSITLDEVCDQKKINPEILKIDVHGAEKKVLMGSKNILDKKVKIIILELHSNEYIKKFSDDSNRKEVIEFLIAKKFKCFLISEFRILDKKNNEHLPKKLKFIDVTRENFDQIFFDRDFSDQLIFACKEEVDINSLDCFN